jgi:sulfane dehydrogenase subunit SoxC
MPTRSTKFVSRRAFLATSAATATLPVLGAEAQPRSLGDGRRLYGERSSFEKSTRSFGASTASVPTGSSRTPLQDLYGIITPSSLHFERHHSGVPAIDPATHELVVHGRVERPIRLTMHDLRRFPSVSRVHFIECAGNAGREHRGNPGPTAQLSHGLVSCSEWTGVLLRTVLNEVGVKAGATWVIAEGADAARHVRSIPIAKALDDAIIAYGQNGEAIRPEQGYPLRLVVPGWEGNVSVKWLQRLQLADEPAMARDEAASYTDLMPDGRAKQFTFEMDTNSVITHPSGGHRLEQRGFHEITGIAWSGAGRIAKVEVSTDQGRSWQVAELQNPVFTKALTRFRFPWRWDGSETTLESRATDETGYVQPTRDVLIAKRGMKEGPDGLNHYHGIKRWYVKSSGEISHV